MKILTKKWRQLVCVLLCNILLISSFTTFSFAADNARSSNSLSSDHVDNFEIIKTDIEPSVDFSMDINYFLKNESQNNFDIFSSASITENESEPILYDGLPFAEYRAENQKMDINNLTISFDSGETIVTDDSFDFQGLYKTTSVGAIQTFAAAPLPDLYITTINVSQGGNTPMQAYSSTHVDFRMYNAGSAITNTFEVGVFEDGAGLFLLTFPSFPANNGGLISFDLGNGFKYGTYDISLFADAFNDVTEADESNNNDCADEFTFTGTSNLIIADGSFQVIDTCYVADEDNEYTTGDVYSMDDVAYGFTIVNNGNAPSFGEELELFIGGKLVGSGNGLPQIEPYTSYPAMLVLKFRKQGQYMLDLRIDSISYASCSTYVNYDLSLEKFYWSDTDASDLTVQIYKSATDEFSKDFLESYMAWNGKNSGVYINSYITDPQDNDLNCNIMLFGDDELPLGVLGQHDSWADGDNHNQGSFIWLNTVTSLIDESTVIHEFGHSLGLDHHECDDFSIMQQYHSDDYRSDFITEHDVYNLDAIY